MMKGSATGGSMTGGSMMGSSMAGGSARKELSEAARRALAEAAQRRERREAEAREAARELGGRAGPDPVRYSDWENKGIASDF